MALVSPSAEPPPDVHDRPDRPGSSLSRSSDLTLARKLAGIGGVFLAVALFTVGLSMWVTWQLEGGAAAINEAGRMRMRSYQIALQVRDLQAGRDADALQGVMRRVAELDGSLALLTNGDSRRPLSVPGNHEV